MSGGFRRVYGTTRRTGMTFRTRFQRIQAACDLLRDLNIRATNAITKEVTALAVELLSAPPEYRRANEPRVLELLAEAADRRLRLGYE